MASSTPHPPPPLARVQRRAVLRALGASGFLAAWGGGPGLTGAPALAQAVVGSASSIRFASYPFTCGVASGAPAADGMVLWTRLGARALPGGLARGSGEASAIPVVWELAHDEAFHTGVQRGEALARPELGYAVHVEPTGLESDRWYYYRFRAGDASSPVGRTRTLPAPQADVQRLRLAYASCQKWEDGYFAAWRHMATEQVDAVVFLGDYLYEYPARNSRVRVPPGGWVVTLDDYRARYALYKSDPDLQAMHAAAPWWVTWDDHEVQNDYAGLQGGNSGATSPAVADFAARRAAAYQAYFENMPLRRSALMRGLQGLAQGAELRLYGHARYGQLASVLMLDARQYKDPQPCNPPGSVGSRIVNPAQCKDWSNPQRSVLGMAQEQWLGQTLGSAAVREARWTVLGQSTLLGPRDFGSGTEQRLWNDGWDGYPAARQRLIDDLQKSAAPNPVILGGDVHEHWVGHVLADYQQPHSPAVAVEFCGAGITSNAGNAQNAAQRTAAQRARNPHFIYAESEHRGYGIADFTPERLSVTLRGLDDVTRQDSGIQTLARFAVEAGSSRVRRVDAG